MARSAILAFVSGRNSEDSCQRHRGEPGESEKYNFERYHYQGIGRYEPDAVYARGVSDLQVLADLVPGRGFLFGPQPCSIDAGIYGFVANIFFYEIDTPLKTFFSSQPNLVRHCRSVHDAVMG